MTYTATHTYSVSDVEVVMRRFSADIIMIAQSSQAITEAKAHDYAHDVEVLAKKGYLKSVDLTLLSGSVEVRAAQYVVNTAAGGLMTSRPGGVLWPRVAQPDLRIVLSYNATYSTIAREAMRALLRVVWVSTNADTNHYALAQSGGRDYTSNGWGLQRKDFGL